MSGHPGILTPAGHVEAMPRRLRGYLGGRVVLDTCDALYVWERPAYPHYHVPADAVDGAVLEALRAAGHAQVHAAGRLAGTARIVWGALDAWFEEDEEVFVHPRDPYTRVDALRSSRAVRVTLDGVLLAASRSPVLVFETGLPTRCYLDRADVDLERLVPSATVTACPYKGRTTGWWSALGRGDVAWSYGFPTAALQAIAGLIAFYDERVDVTLD